MLKLQIAGFIGADARELSADSYSYKFPVAHSVRHKDGTESTQWVDVLIPRDFPAMRYLKKGARVWCQGIPSFSCYSSPVAKKFLPAVTMTVTSYSDIEIQIFPNDTSNQNT